MVRSGRLALPTPDWRTGTLLLRHERMSKLGPCRLRPSAGFNHIRLGEACSGLGQRTGASLRKMVALTGIAPVSLGLKGRDPQLLDDKAEKKNTRPASPFNAIRRTACWCRTVLSGPAISQKRTHTVAPLGRQCLPDWTAAGFARGRWADWLGSAMKPLKEYGKKSSHSFPEAAHQGTKKPTSGRKWASREALFQPRVRLNHFLGDSRNRADKDLVHYAFSLSSVADE